jgi:hypothetical protein
MLKPNEIKTLQGLVLSEILEFERAIEDDHKWDKEDIADFKKYIEHLSEINKKLSQLT